MASSYNIKLTNIDSLDLQQFCAFHRNAFSALFQKNKVVQDYMIPEFFQWKYKSPAGEAVIAVVEKEGQVVTSTALVPVEIIYNNRLYKSWQVVDGATDPAHREKGLFDKCMKVLREELRGDDIQFGFPNNKSMGKFIKNGHVVIEKIGFYSKLNLLKTKDMQFDSNQIFDNRQTEFVKKNPHQGTASIFHSSEYMNWRYASNPRGGYFWHSVKDGNSVFGYVVMRPISIKGTRILLLMEYFFMDHSTEKELNRFIEAIATKEKCRFTCIFSGKLNKPAFATMFMLKVPSLFLPKKQILTAASNDPNHPLLNVQWHVQTGDWDAF